MKNIGWNDLPPESMTVFNGLLQGSSSVAPRVWLEAEEPVRAVRVEAGFQGQNFTLQGITGLSANEPNVSGLDRILLRGRWFKDGEKRAVIIPARLAERLFPYEDPINRTIYIREHDDYYRIVGVLKHREASAAVGGSLSAQDFSSDAYIPISTMRTRIGDTIVERAKNPYAAFEEDTSS